MSASLERNTVQKELPPDVYPITDDMKMSVMLQSYLKAMDLGAGDTFSFNAYLAWLDERIAEFCRLTGTKLIDNMLPDKKAQQHWFDWLEKQDFDGGNS